jgi:DNA-binding transcriptional ArsR family regulator
MINAIVNDIDATFAVLAEPTRRQVVELLSAGPLRAGEIADRVGTSRPAMSRHLRALRAGGLVEVELSDPDGRGRTYRLSPDRLVALRAWLDQMQAYWTAQLGSFKQHAERRSKP